MPSSSELFGSNVFDYETMAETLPKATYRALMESIKTGAKLERGEADAIAHAMMGWAISKGATHYTHWFQPMTGRTAQKHDAFLSVDQDLHAIERFSGSQLIQSEPDASSFPSGGMRTTFEARGYTTWDPSSPAFILNSGKVSVLCIPSVYFSYTGLALDKKTPILRSSKALNQAASKAWELLTGEKTRVIATVGAEQEYFLIDRDYYEQRPDLIMTGRTLIGRRPPKDQQMEDHYFGSIKDRALNFMEDVEQQLYKLGVPCKTRHNEVAPHQYEMAPTFLNANLSADQNQLVMERLQSVANERGLAVLLHEKPFAGMNGSGKHMNWSMQTTEGVNLLEPGHDPRKNLIFLYFLTAAIVAVHRRGALLRGTIASAGNDHRLGANEAPPAIMSVFLGEHLDGILNQLEKAESISKSDKKTIDLGLELLPEILKDTTDRNRTSPFAFTGNKFELRAVGSSQSLSLPVAILNAAVAEALNEMNAKLKKLKDPNDETAMFKLLRPFIKDSKAIRFEGNNYSEEWEKEAAKRGLPNLKTTPEALAAWGDKDNRKLLKSLGILTEHEIEAHQIVKYETYVKQIDIEAATMIRLVDNYVVPAGFDYQKQLAESISALQATGANVGSALDWQLDRLSTIAQIIGKLIESRNILRDSLDKTRELEEKESIEKVAQTFAKKVVPAMEEVREHCDNLEELSDHDVLRLPTYHELLFHM